MATKTRDAPISESLVAEMEAIAADRGCELLAIEYGGDLLRLVLDRAEGKVEIADCEEVSRQVSPLLDVDDFGDRRYTLEVSSPGLDRRLYGPRDYERFCGRLARVTFHPGGGGKRTVVGRLKAYRAQPGEGEIDLEPADHSKETMLTVPLDAIEEARLEIEL